MYIHFVFCGLIILLVQELRAANLVQINPGLVNKQVDRFVDLSSQLSKLSNKITLENTGKSAVKNFLFTIEPEFSAHLSFVYAQTGDSSKTPLQVQPIKVEGHESEPFWQIEIGALQPGKTITVDIEIAYTYVLSPHPAAITQNDKQLVRYSGNHYFYSPYATLKQSTTVTLNTRNIESYSKLKPVSQSENKINYGPYEKIPGFSVDTLTVHYENNSPFLSITKLERVIEVSHWGNIAVEETIDVKHTGAVLKGPFSRYEYQRESHSGVSSIKSFKTILPAAASDAYYRDEIGNISTSHMKVMSDSVELDLRPRFPLFGGWKTHYVIGYNVPSYEYLYNAGDDFLLKMRLVDHVFDDMVVDEVVTKIILPEGSHDIQLSTPYAVERLPDTLHFTYLDTTGRPVITLRKKNLVEHHIQDFDLQYTFPKTLMFQEPLLVVIAFYLLFILVIIYVRLDFSITKDEAGESRMRISGFCEKVLAHQDKRAEYYSLTDDQLAKLKSSKDVTAFQTAMKNINRDYKNETSHIAELVTKLKIDAPEIADKVLELQKLDTHLKELYVHVQSLYVDKLVPGKINRQQFLDLEGHLNKKKEDCVDKINALVKSLH